MDMTNVYMFVVVNWQKKAKHTFMAMCPDPSREERDVNRSKLMVSYTSEPVYGLLGCRALCGVHIKEG